MITENFDQKFGLKISRDMVFVITINQFIQYMRKATLLFRNASGKFYNDRWKPIAEGIINLILSLLFVYAFPEDIKMVGVIVATIVTDLLICDTVEPFVIFKHVFSESPKQFYIKNYIYIALFICTLLGLSHIIIERANSIAYIFINGFISVGMGFVLLMLVALFDKSFREAILFMTSKMVRWMRRSWR